MDARALDVVQAGNGTTQLAFETTAIAGGFHELTGAEALFFIENLEADIAVGLGNAGAGQLQPRTGKVVGLDGFP